MMYISFIVEGLKSVSCGHSSCMGRQVSTSIYVILITNNFTVATTPGIEPTVEYTMLSPNARLQLNNENLSGINSNLTANIEKSGMYICRACNVVGCGERYINVTIKGIFYHIHYISLCIERT